MHTTLRQLRLFLALADTGSVSGAAKAMHVTQPTASMQLKDMAQSIGMPLFEVVGKKIYLTETGKELAVTARTMTQTWAAFEQSVDASRGLQRGKLRVAAVSTAKYFMPRWIGGFCSQYPDVDVSMEILNRDGVVQRMRDNRDDLYIMSAPPTDLPLSDTVLMPNPIVVIAPSADPLTLRKRVRLQDIAQHRFILREKGSGTRMAVDQFFRSHRFRPHIRLELGSNESVKESVAGGLGLGVLSIHALHGLRKEHGVSVIEVEGFPLESAWHIVHPAGKKLSPLAQAFEQHLVQQTLRGKGRSGLSGRNVRIATRIN